MAAKRTAPVSTMGTSGLSTNEQMGLLAASGFKIGPHPVGTMGPAAAGLGPGPVGTMGTSGQIGLEAKRERLLQLRKDMVCVCISIFVALISWCLL